jgi:hypothetical protein
MFEGGTYRFCFESYGVPVMIESDSAELLAMAEQTVRSALLGNLVLIDRECTQQLFSLISNRDGTCKLLQNGELMVEDEPNARFWKFFDSLVRILVAEFTKSVVFVHAGVVGWKGRAIILPGNSFFGKTTLVAELINRGATYYSDEYAVFDEDGLVHPFARPLSLRTSGPNIDEMDLPVAELGGQKGEQPLPIGSVVFTKYKPDSDINIEFLTKGQGILEIIGQTIAIKRNTEFAINVLKKAFTNAIILKSPRPDTVKFAGVILEFVDNTTI